MRNRIMSTSSDTEAPNLCSDKTHQLSKKIISIIGQHVVHIRPHDPTAEAFGVIKKIERKLYDPPPIVEDCRDIIWLDENRHWKDSQYSVKTDWLGYLTVGKEPDNDCWSVTKVTYHDIFGMGEYSVAYGTEEEVLEKAIKFVGT